MRVLKDMFNDMRKRSDDDGGSASDSANAKKKSGQAKTQPTDEFPSWTVNNLRKRWDKGDEGHDISLKKHTSFVVGGKPSSPRKQWNIKSGTSVNALIRKSVDEDGDCLNEEEDLKPLRSVTKFEDDSK